MGRNELPIIYELLYEWVSSNEQLSKGDKRQRKAFDLSIEAAQRLFAGCINLEFIDSGNDG